MTKSKTKMKSCTLRTGPEGRIARKALYALLLTSCLYLGLAHSETRAAAPDPLAHKVSTDLRLAIDAAKPARQPWLREAAGQRWVRVVVTGQRRSADLAEARKDITQRGGNVVSHDPSIATVVAVLPAAQVRGVAARTDVLHIAPDRTMEAAAKAPAAAGGSTQLAAYGLGPNSARAISDKALLGE
jgi:hypothetical protein